MALGDDAAHRPGDQCGNLADSLGVDIEVSEIWLADAVPLRGFAGRFNI